MKEKRLRTPELDGRPNYSCVPIGLQELILRQRQVRNFAMASFISFL